MIAYASPDVLAGCVVALVLVFGVWLWAFRSTLRDEERTRVLWWTEDGGWSEGDPS